MKNIYKIIPLTILCLALIGDKAFAQTTTTDEEKLPYQLLDTFGEVYSLIRESYVTEKTDEDLVKAAIRGMLQSLDPHSDYLEKEKLDNFETQTKGEFGGLGIEVTMEGGFVKIVAPRDDTPASRAGLQTNDLITHIDGLTVQGLSLNDCVALMRGPLGDPITITVLRKNKDPFEVTLVRERIVLHSVRWRREKDIGYLRLASFTKLTENELTQAIKSLKLGKKDEKDKKGTGISPKAYVLDLRRNPGGLLDQAIKVSDMFLDKGEIVSTRGREQNMARRFQAKAGDIIEDLPLVVLVDGGSASASEIVAGALKDHGRAVLIGTKTFGKGSVQTLYPLETKSDALVKITVQLYYTPSGKSIQARGIDPDIEVSPANVETLAVSAIPQGESTLTGAITVLEEDGGLKENITEKYSEATSKDYQLVRALDLAYALSISNNIALSTQK